MNFKNYKLPLQPGLILKKEQHPECVRIEESIAHNIHLILMTRFGENRFDESYGNAVWEYDFEILPQISKWQTHIANSIADSIRTHEKRLINIKVKVSVDQKEFPNDEKNNIPARVKRRIQVIVNAKLIKTNESFRFEEAIYFSPISLD